MMVVTHVAPGLLVMLLLLLRPGTAGLRLF
jgi:hypothetical protein